MTGPSRTARALPAWAPPVALAIALAFAWVNFLSTARWANLPGALQGWRLPWYAAALAGKDRLDIRDEVRLIRPGFYLGRAYFRGAFGLNFTLVDPAVSGSSAPRPPGVCTQAG